jgi:type II secretory pathway component PulF
MNFNYRAKDRAGQTVNGNIDADSLSTARTRLREQGLYVVTIQAQRATSTTNTTTVRRSGGSIKKADLMMTFSQLTIMCQSGVDLAEALKQVADQCPKQGLRIVLQNVYQSVAQGQSLSNSLSQHPQVFDESLVAGIAAGEQSGTIVQVLERLTQLIRGEIRLRSSVWSMLTYPLVLCGVTGMVILAMLFFVLPQFAKVFADLERPTPALTQFLLSIGDELSSHWIICLGSVCGIGITLFSLRNTLFVKKAWDYLFLNLAMFKTASRSLLTGRVFQLLGTMLASGVPLVEGVRLCRTSIKNQYFRELFGKLEHDIMQGEGLGKPLLAASFLPIGAAHMVSTAERTGKLSTVLQSVGAYYEDEGERSLRDAIKILEPVIIIVMGLIVAVVVLSIVLPLLDISTMSGNT